MNLWTIRAAVIGWLRYEQRCYTVAFERSPWPTSYRPDVFGINRHRKVIEVEIKQTVADFKANAQKRLLRWREATGLYLPQKFYFAVPNEIVDKVKPFLPSRCGLLSIEPTGRFGPTAVIVAKATSELRSDPITAHHMVAVLMHQTGSLHRAAVALSKLT